ncbi:PREDICTED: pumilio homolog 23 [Camelina sativa]|uniref:Pumilio homolog 23 n=1 Tax=Camelina sativa TaxID=90675 RepID=A0ABM0WHR9_CAMSA|nr:PREDICTED: pumilio homolog 23 [Camelina sativa]
MVSVGSKSLPSRRHRTTEEDSLMGERGKSSNNNHSDRKKGMFRKDQRGGRGFDGDSNKRNQSGGAPNVKPASKKQSEFEHQNQFVRKEIDPETSKYFSEIANLFDSNEVDLEERSVICGNALEETRGREYEIATDYIISHVLQTLLEGCELDQLCSFIRNSAEVFPAIAMDRSGSHVAESALKALATHLENPDAYSVIEEALNSICQVIVDKPLDMLCNCYSSHVLRRLLCLCKGVSLDSPELYGTKSSKALAKRLNLKTSQLDESNLEIPHQGFPDVLKYLLSGLLSCSREDMKYLQVDQYSSLVLQTALRLMVKQDEELLEIIPLVLGCNSSNKKKEGFHIDTKAAKEILEPMKDNSFSHLVEVILEVAPENLYNEIFNKVFKNSLFELSVDRCANFVIQALISHAKDQEQMGLIWEELAPRVKDLLEQGKSGVVASLIAASQRLQCHEHKCCEALVGALCSTNESRISIVPRLLFLDSYFGYQDKSTWEWAPGAKMHVMGSLILQGIFKFSSDHIQPYITSLTSMKADYIIETAKDSSGARVIEAFLASNAATKQKRRLIIKLRGHFGELSLHTSGSFTVEKCFDACNLTLREAIATELLDVRVDLSKAKQGPYLLRKLDIDGYASRPEQWKSRQESKQSTYNEFCSAFGSNKSNFPKNTFVSDASEDAPQELKVKNTWKEVDHHSTSGIKRHREEHARDKDEPFAGEKRTKQRKNKTSEATDKPKLAGSKRPFLSGEMTGKNRHSNKLRI